jgi:hypothetical protein
MALHTDSTAQHQIHDSSLVYADEATLLAATPASTLYHRIGYATAEATYWVWTSQGWSLLVDATGASTFDRIVCNTDGVVVHDGEVVTI